MEHQWNKSILNNQPSYLDLMVSALGFMDDVTWIASSKHDMEKILCTADDFYTMTRSAINKDKTKILTNTDTNGPVKLRFGSTLLDITPEQQPIRFLGTWIHPSLTKTRAFTIKLVTALIDDFKNKIKFKRITDKQL